MSRFISRFAVSLLAALLAFPAAAQFTVNSMADGSDASPGDGNCATAGGDCTLRAAMQEAAASAVPEEVILPEGTYAWNLGQLLIESGDITISGAGARTTIVDAGGGQRFFEFDGNATLVTIRDVEFQNGFDGNDPGGAIETDVDLLLLERVVFRNCVTQDGFGGAIHNREDLEVRACSFIDCKAFGNDGASGGGGGGGSLAGGGAISSWSQTSTWLENCTFTGCEARGGDGGGGGGGGSGGDGGSGIGSFGGGGDGGDITSSTWGGNNPDAGNASFGGGGGGGGILTSWWNSSPGDASNGLVLGGNGGNGTLNVAGGGGGGGAMGGAFFMRGGDATVLHCTMHGNGAFGGEGGASVGNAGESGMGKGGGIGCFNGTVTMDNSIIYGNSIDAGGVEDLYHYSGDEILATVGHNILGVLDVDIVFGAAVVGNQIGVDPVLLAYGDYGGPTDAFMISACEPLSPAIDAGAALGITEDQRGEPRDASPDIGAIEGPAPVELLPLSEVVCPGESAELTLTWPDAVTTWPDGSEGDTWTSAAVSGMATITTAEGCEEEIAIDVTEVAIEQPDLGPDQTVCPGSVITLDAGNPGAQFSWSTGGFGQAELVADSGTVEVLVVVNGCTATDEMQVSWFDTYPLDLGEDIVLCYGEDVTLDADVPGWDGLPASFNWQGGPGEAEYTVDASGTYTVTATLNGCITVDDIQVTESPLTTVDLGADETICPGDPFILDPNYPTAVCTWQDGSIGPTYPVTNTGIYTVNVSLGDCQANAQVFIEVVQGFDAALPEVANFCEGDSVLLLAAFGASNYTWQNGATGNQLWASQPGIYEVSSFVEGCAFVDQVSVVPQPLPMFNFGLDIVLCEGESIELAPGVPGADYVVFNDSLTTPSLTVFDEGEYFAEVSLGGCTYRDTVSVEVRPIPEFSLPADSVLCPGDVLLIETGLSDVLVTWNTGEVGNAIEVNEPASYVATSQVSGCQFVDSMTVGVAQPITIPLSANYELCLDDTIVLNALQGAEVYPSTYRWDNGSILPTRVIDRGGEYTVEVTNVCDTAVHVLEVEQLICGCQVYVPSAFTPNNDGKNDAWQPVLDCEPYTYQVTVWDRWGRPVFFSDKEEEVWYGQVEGTPGSKTRESGRYFAIDGVYMWEVIIELRNGRIPEVIRQNGTVHVLR